MEIGIEQVEDQPVAYVRRTVPMAELQGFYEQSLGTVAARAVAAGGQLTGAPFGWYHGVPGETVDVAGGFPVSGLSPGVVVGGEGDDVEVVVGVRMGGRAVVAMHVGPFDELEESYREVEAWMEAQGVAGRDDMWEEYLTDPEEDPDPSTWETRIVLPLR